MTHAFAVVAALACTVIDTCEGSNVERLDESPRTARGSYRFVFVNRRRIVTFREIAGVDRNQTGPTRGSRR